ncbi:MAG TPA: hypothetical protein VF678_05705 [bacterium]
MRARFDETGRPQAFFAPELAYAPEALQGAVEISDDAWQEFLAHPGTRRWDGQQVVPCDPPAVPVEDARAAALLAIDAEAERARLRYITPGAGQAMTYLMKAQQAQAYKDADYTGTVPPLVQAAATGRGLSAQQAADLILATQAAWETVGAAIEQARESGKAAVTAAGTSEAIAIAANTAVNALQAI